MDLSALRSMADDVLLRELRALVAADLSNLAALLAHVAEVDARRLYAPAGFSSMFKYCVRELRMSEDVAFKRIRAARAASAYPQILPAIRNGRLTLSALVLMAPHLNPGNAAELLQEAECKTNRDVEKLIAARFPQPDVPTVIRAIPSVPSTQLAVRPVQEMSCERPPGVAQALAHAGPAHTVAASPPPASNSVIPAAPTPPAPPTPPARLAPLSPERYALQVTLSAATREKLQHARALLGHAVPSGDISQVLDRALDALIVTLERRKLAAVAKPGTPRGSKNPRHVSATVRRQVWERDGGRCTYVAPDGRRCEARTRLEYDHVLPVARGGDARASQVRLLCRTHNRVEAERVLGGACVREGIQESRARARAPGVATSA